MNDLMNVDKETYTSKLGSMFKYLTTRKPREIVKAVWNPYVRKYIIQKPPWVAYTGVDIGAGCGQYTAVLRKWGFNVVAVEPNRKLIEDSNVPYIIRSGENTPFSDKHFDFSFAINVLHHTDKWEGILREMQRISKLVILSELNAKNRFVKSFIKLRLPFDDIDHHWTKEQLLSGMLESGLDVLEFKYVPLFGVKDVFMWAVAV